MTREEAINIIKERIRITDYIESSYVDSVDIDALKTIIEALEQTAIVYCKDCLLHGACTFERGLGEEGFCSQGILI